MPPATARAAFLQRYRELTADQADSEGGHHD
jgi:hypothetical protein